MPRQSRQPGDHGDVLAQLENDRTRNDLKLKSRFEHIFRKYERDFSGVGDEFDIHTNEIVVNNGHLEHMRSENDPGRDRNRGSSASSRFLTTFQEQLEHEVDSSEEGEEDDGDEYTDDEAEDEDDEDSVATDLDSQPALSRTATPSLQPFSRNNRPMLPRLAELLMGNGSEQHPYQVLDDDRDDSLPPSGVTTATSTPAPANLLDHIPGLGAALSSMDSARSSRRGTPDSSTIHALGTSIASQLVHLMDQRKKKSRKSTPRPTVQGSDPIWSYPQLSHRTPRSRKRTRSPVTEPPPTSPSRQTPEHGSVWAVEDAVRPGKRRRKSKAPATEEPAIRRLGKIVDKSEAKRCWNCSLTRSLRWSEGPHGQDLCASCGDFYDRYGRMKGMDSATPSVQGDELEILALDDVEPPAPGQAGEDAHDQISSSPPPQLLIPVSHASNWPLPASQQSAYRATPESSVKPEPRPTPRLSEARQTPRPSDIGQTPIRSYSPNTSRPMTPAGAPMTGSPKWTTEEEYSIIILKEHEKLTWPEIGRRFPHRNAFVCQARYSSKLHNRQCEARDLFNARLRGLQGDGAPASTIGWTEEQDSLLSRLRDEKQLSWTDIAKQISGQTAHSVEQRYHTIAAVKIEQYERAMSERQQTVELEDAAGASPSLKNAHFRAEEDALVVRLKEIEGLSWSQIANRFEGREMTSIQKRYTKFLSPDRRRTTKTVRGDPVRGTMEDRIIAVDAELIGDAIPTVERRPWNAEEDDQLQALRDGGSLAWEQIAAHLSGRSADMLRHRYDYVKASARLPYPASSGPTPTAQRATPGHSRASMTPDSRAITSPGTASPTPNINDFGSPQRSTAANSSPWTPNRAGEAAFDHDANSAEDDASSRLGSKQPCSVDENAIDDYRRKFTAEEDEAILRLRDTGMTWVNMTAHIPGRTAASLSTRFNQGLSKGRIGPRRSLPTSLSSVMQSSATNLLRQAVGNRLRRHTYHVPCSATPSAQANPDARGQLTPLAASQHQSRTPMNMGTESSGGEDEAPAATHQLTQDLAESSPTTSANGSSDYDHHTLEYSIQEPASPQIDPALYQIGSCASKDAPRHSMSSSIASHVNVDAIAPALRSTDPQGSRRKTGSSSTVKSARAKRARRSASGRSIQAHASHTSETKRGTTNPVPAPAAIADLVTWAEVENENMQQDALLAKPDISREELIRGAFAAHDSPILLCKDMYAWVEANFQYYRTAAEDWKSSLRRELQRNPAFVSPSKPGKRTGQWRLKQDSRTLQSNYNHGEQPGDDITAVDYMSLSAAPHHHQPASFSVPQHPDDSTIMSTPLADSSPKSASRRVTFDEVVRVKVPETRSLRKRTQKRVPAVPSPANNLRSALKVRHGLNDPGDSTDTDTPTRPAGRAAAAKSPERAELLAKFQNAAPGRLSDDPAQPPQSSPSKQSPAEPESTGSMNNTTPQSSSSPLFLTFRDPVHNVRTPKMKNRSRLSSGTSVADFRSGSHLVTVSGRKRLVETPVRVLMDPEEDELA